MTDRSLSQWNRYQPQYANGSEFYSTLHYDVDDWCWEISAGSLKDGWSPDEVMEIHPKPLAEVMHMAQANEISDGPSALALLLCTQRLKELTGAT